MYDQQYIYNYPIIYIVTQGLWACFVIILVLVPDNKVPTMSKPWINYFEWIWITNEWIWIINNLIVKNLTNLN